MAAEAQKTVRAIIGGRVQGVYFRAWTVEQATELGLSGWVRNRRDGTVEAVFSGDGDTVEQMLQLCRRGPERARVTHIERVELDGYDSTGFEARPTA